MNGFDLDLVAHRRPAGGEPFRLVASLCTPPGITVVTGPSGAGKTTLVWALLGILDEVRGRIAIGGRVLLDSDQGRRLSPRRRRVGVVFQDASLFPHLDGLANVAFGIRTGDRRARAREWLERTGAGDLGRRRPAEMSGGQRQRVALARALAAEPAALLLDEPFSALDAPGRQTLGALLGDLQCTTGIPFLHVTHDLGEAIRLGDHLVLLDRGQVLQTGAPLDVVTRPASLDAARAVGTDNLFAARVVRHAPARGCSEVDLGGVVVQTGLLARPEGGPVTLGLRAEDVLVATEPPGPTSARNVIAGQIEQARRRGTWVELLVRTAVPLRVAVTPISVEELGLDAGRRVWLIVKASAFHPVD